jgi:hypothetical protein
MRRAGHLRGGHERALVCHEGHELWTPAHGEPGVRVLHPDLPEVVGIRHPQPLRRSERVSAINYSGLTPLGISPVRRQGAIPKANTVSTPRPMPITSMQAPTTMPKRETCWAK